MRTREEARRIAKQLANQMRRFTFNKQRTALTVGGYRDFGQEDLSTGHYIEVRGLINEKDEEAVRAEIRKRVSYAQPLVIHHFDSKQVSIFVKIRYQHDFGQGAYETVAVERLRKRATKLGYKIVRKDSSDQDDGRSVTVTDSHR